MNTGRILDEAIAELNDRNFSCAIELCTQVLSEAPDSDEGVACRLIRATSYELIESSERDRNLLNAIEDYSALINKVDWISAIGHSGLARALYFQDRQLNAEEIKKTC